MAYPTDIDTFPTAADLADDNLDTKPHSTLHGNLGIATAALEGKVGVSSSAVVTSHDYLIAHRTAALAAKGDLLTATAANTPAIVTAGTNGFVLTAQSGQTSGLLWATPVGIDTGAVPKSTVTAAGDLIIGTAASTVSNLAITTNAGKAVVADPNAANKVSINYPQSVEEANWGSTAGTLATTYDRTRSIYTAAGGLTSGTLKLAAIWLPKGLPVTNIAAMSGTTAATGPTHQWFGLFDSSRVVLAKTADDTTTAWTATTLKTLAVTGGPFVTTYAGWHYVGVLATTTVTQPTLEVFSGFLTTGSRALGLLAVGNSTTGLTDPASCTGTQTTITLATGLHYMEIS